MTRIFNTIRQSMLAQATPYQQRTQSRRDDLWVEHQYRDQPLSQSRRDGMWVNSNPSAPTCRPYGTEYLLQMPHQFYPQVVPTGLDIRP
jgi:hypothetical protein